MGDVLHHFVEAGPLHFLVLEVAEGVADEVEEDAALTQLLDKQILALHQRRIWKTGPSCSHHGFSNTNTVGAAAPDSGFQEADVSVISASLAGEHL